MIKINPTPTELRIERKLEIFLGNLLRLGVLVSALVMLIGAAIYLWSVGFSIRPDYSVFSGEASNLRSISGIFKNVFSADGRGMIQLGIILLIATPILRVVFSLVGFIIEKDRLYVLLTLIVLAVLSYSLLFGRLG